MRYHELALQRWLNSTFYAREGYPVPVVFSTPMDAFATFDKLWRSENNPYKYLFDLKDERGTPLYEPFPSNARYPLISVYRRNWKYRPEQNYSIHQFRHMNWPTVSSDVLRSDLANVTVSYRPMAWSYSWQIDHFAMRPDTQAFFIEALMRSLWITGGVPQTWVKVHYPAWGWQQIRIFLEGDIDNSTPEEPEEGKPVVFRTSFTIVMEGYSVDQNLQIIPALWTLLVRGQEQALDPDELHEAFEAASDLRIDDNNATLNARPNVPPDLTRPQQHTLAQFGTYPAYDIFFNGTSQPTGYYNFGFTSTNTSNPYFLGGVAQTSGYGVITVGSV
jgi:hypothetical protein